MLDNLNSLDLSGVDGYIRYSYNNSAEALGAVIISIGIIIFIIGVLMILNRFLIGSRTKQYRETLGDMYVVGKIKQLADKDKIDLTKELGKFMKITRKNRSSILSIDEVVARQLKDKIDDEKERLVK